MIFIQLNRIFIDFYVLSFLSTRTLDLFALMIYNLFFMFNKYFLEKLKNKSTLFIWTIFLVLRVVF